MSLNIIRVTIYRTKFIEMLKDTNLMVIKSNYLGNTEQQSERGVLKKNIADSVPSISSFLVDTN